MRRIGSVHLGLVAVSLLLPAATYAKDDDATAIARDVDERFAKACNAGDQATLLTLYADGASVIFPGEPLIGEDRAAITGMLERSCDPESGVSYRLDAIRGTRLGPDHISVVGTWTITVPGPDGKPSANKARATEILVRSDAGWRYLVDHASAAPPAAPPPPTM